MLWRQNGSKCSWMVYPRDYVARTGACGLLPMPSITRVPNTYCLPRKPKKPSSESEMQFLLNTYCFCTIVKREKIVNHQKSGTARTSPERDQRDSLPQGMKKFLEGNTSFLCSSLQVGDDDGRHCHWNMFLGTNGDNEIQNRLWH